MAGGNWNIIKNIALPYWDRFDVLFFVLCINEGYYERGREGSKMMG